MELLVNELLQFSFSRPGQMTASEGFSASWIQICLPGDQKPVAPTEELAALSGRCAMMSPPFTTLSKIGTLRTIRIKEEIRGGGSVWRSRMGKVWSFSNLWNAFHTHDSAKGMLPEHDTKRKVGIVSKSEMDSVLNLDQYHKSHLSLGVQTRWRQQ